VKSGVVSLKGEVPPGIEKEAKAVNSDLDNGIEQNLDAALIENQMHANVKYNVKSGVVTLSGEVNSEDKRTRTNICGIWGSVVMERG